MKNIIVLLAVLIIMVGCNGRSRVKNTIDNNETGIKTIFSISSIDDSLACFIKSSNDSEVFTVTYDDIYGYPRLIFWAGIGIPLKISRENDKIHIYGGKAKMLDTGKIIAVDSLSLKILTPIIDSRGFSSELYMKCLHLNKDQLVAIFNRKIYKIVDMKELEPID